MLSQIKLTVLFDEPFWIGVFETIEGTQYKVCKVTFGAEPKDEEIFELIAKKNLFIKFQYPNAN